MHKLPLIYYFLSKETPIIKYQKI